MSLFSEDRTPPPDISNPVHIRLNQMTLPHPRQWGGCWLATELWHQLELDTFWKQHLAASRKGTKWLNVLKTLVSYRLLDPGSEWRLHRDWFKNTAMADLLDADHSVAAKDTLYRCLDKLLEHKEDLFSFLKERWSLMFNASYDILLYDLTSTYFESKPPENADALRRFGYSRDKRSDCVQVVIALIITPEGFPIAYEVMPGNTSDKSTLPHFLEQIERQYGKRNRLWIMDRGIPTEEALGRMRREEASYLVGTPRGRLTKLEKQLFRQPWKRVQDQIEVKLTRDGEDLYVLTRSGSRRDRERAMRQRKLKLLLQRLHELSRMKTLSRDQLVAKIAVAKHEAGRSAAHVVTISLPLSDASFCFKLDRAKLSPCSQRRGNVFIAHESDCG